uniref:Uncharacterized protein n=1 Tax=Arundo donax TaxID=35708 RepID=A0A0A9BNJ5_ARUDO
MLLALSFEEHNIPCNHEYMMLGHSICIQIELHVCVITLYINDLEGVHNRAWCNYSFLKETGATSPALYWRLLDGNQKSTR